MVFPSLNFTKFGSQGLIVQSLLALGSMPVLFIHSVSETQLIPVTFQLPFFGFVTWSIVTLLFSTIIQRSKSNKAGKDCHYCEGGKIEITEYTCKKCGKHQ
jgi:hypothetical protein